MEEVDKIFGNVEQLLEFQRSLLNKLDFCMCSWPTQLLGDIFLNTVRIFGYKAAATMPLTYHCL